MHIIMALCRLLGSFLGIFLQFMIVLAILSLVTWNTADPAPSHANINEISNILGAWGAFYADLSMRFFGFSSFVALIPPFFWGMLLSLQQTIHHFFFRFFCWIASIILSGIALALLPSSSYWPKTIAVGQGGIVGDKLAALLYAFWDISSNIFTRLFFILIVIIMSGLFSYASCCLRNNNISLNKSAYKSSKKIIKARNLQKKEKINLFFLMSISRYLCYLIHLAARLQFIFLQFSCKNIRKMLYISADKQSNVLQNKSFHDYENEYSGLEISSDNIRNSNFKLPPISCLSMPQKADCEITNQLPAYNLEMLSRVLEDFGIKGEIISVRSGPVVTIYELELAPGIKSARVISLANDIARSMRAISARVAVIPGRNVMGIELPNTVRQTVSLREIFETRTFQENHTKLGLVLGRTISGEIFIADLTKMPHLLIAGTTGAGKSVSINTMILSILYRMTPEECRMIMIDPKMLELSVYDGIPHLLTPVITNASEAIVALKWAVREMEERYCNMAKLGVRNIDGFNQRVRTIKNQKKNLSRTVQTGFDKKTGEPIYETEHLFLTTIPYILVIIDEMADLMIMASKEIEGLIQRLAQMSRAAGIHVIMATQRPSVDIITGAIKSNFSTRISFQVASKSDSRTILGEHGAEQLLGSGDMLFMMAGRRIQRIHGPFVEDDDVERVVKYLKTQGFLATPDYNNKN